MVSWLHTCYRTQLSVVFKASRANHRHHGTTTQVILPVSYIKNATGRTFCSMVLDTLFQERHPLPSVLLDVVRSQTDNLVRPSLSFASLCLETIRLV